MVLLTPGASNAVLVGGLAAALANCKIYFYNGPVPVSAAAAVDVSSTMLMKLTNNDDGSTALTWNTAGVANGVLTKTAAEVWKGTFAATGSLVFARICVGSDTGSAASSGTTARLQCSVGTDPSFDIFVPSVAGTSGSTALTFDTFVLLQPQH